MKNKQEIEAEFRAKLQALLAEFDATMHVVESHGYQPYPIGIEVWTSAKYDQNGGTIREGAEFMLRTTIDKDSL